jgi:hypothetical protein
MSVRLLPLLLLVGCPENELHKIEHTETPDPALMVEPDELDFGIIPASTTASDVVTLTNNGDAALDVSNLSISGMTSFSISGEAPIGLLGPGESVEVWVTYDPTTTTETATLTVSSDDPVNPEILVPLRGDAGFPALSADPNPVEFTSVELGVETLETVTLENVGGDTLVIDSMILLGDPFWFVEEPTFPITMEPGEQRELELGFSSEEDGFYDGTLWITTNAPSPTTTVMLEGAAGAGSITGQICEPGGGDWAVNARVWLAADEDGDGIYDWQVEDYTDAEGRFTLDPVLSGTWTVHVEKGSWSDQFDVVFLGGTYELTEPECLDPESVNVAVVEGEYDDIGAILDGMDIDYDTYNAYTYLDLLEDPAALAEYDIIFFNCGMSFSWMDDQDIVADNLRAFVEDGGSVYASDWAYGLVEAGWPSAMDVNGAETLWDPASFDYTRLAPFVGVEGSVDATVEDPTMQTVLGSTTRITYDLGSWVVVESTDASVLLTGDVWTYSLDGADLVVDDEIEDAPLAVRIEDGGTIIYTTFHNEAVRTLEVEEALEEIILAL